MVRPAPGGSGHGRRPPGPGRRPRRPCRHPGAHLPAPGDRHRGDVAGRCHRGGAAPADADGRPRRVHRPDPRPGTGRRRHSGSRRSGPVRVPGRRTRRPSPRPPPRPGGRPGSVDGVRGAQGGPVGPGRAAVHQRLHRRSQRRDAAPRDDLRQPRRPGHRRPPRPRGRRALRMVASLPRHGAHRFAHHRHDLGHGLRARRAPGFPRLTRAVDGVDVAVRGHGHGGAEFLLRPGHPGPAAARCPGPSTCPGAGSPSTAPRRSTRPWWKPSSPPAPPRA